MYDNASLEKPEVLIQQLEAGKAYIATVTALNKKVTFLPLPLFIISIIIVKIIITNIIIIMNISEPVDRVAYQVKI